MPATTKHGYREGWVERTEEKNKTEEEDRHISERASESHPPPPPLPLAPTNEGKVAAAAAVVTLLCHLRSPGWRFKCIFAQKMALKFKSRFWPPTWPRDRFWKTHLHELATEVTKRHFCNSDLGVKLGLNLSGFSGPRNAVESPATQTCLSAAATCGAIGAKCHSFPGPIIQNENAALHWRKRLLFVAPAICPLNSLPA